jgi:AraC-like DNA-binding protein
MCERLPFSAMDALAGLLEAPRATDAFLLRTLLRPPWSIRILDEAPLSLVSLVRGEAWIVPDSGPTVRLGPGDVAIVRGPEHCTFADDPATEPQAVVRPGGCATSVDGTVDLCDAMDLGVRTWGNDPDGPTVILVGTYQLRGEVSERMLAALPTVLSVPAGVLGTPLVPLLAGEIVKDEPGQDAVLDRLLDLLLISTLRAWFSRPGAKQPAWYRAQSDPLVGQALRLLHNNAAHPWTVAELASRVGVSRAALARRFADLVGETPMAYLTSWRLSRAAELLREPSLTLGAVARQVGYGDGFSLSTAFKRVRGISPEQFRARAYGLSL